MKYIPIEIKFLKQQIKSSQRLIDNHHNKAITKVAKKLIIVNEKLIKKIQTTLNKTEK